MSQQFSLFEAKTESNGGQFKPASHEPGQQLRKIRGPYLAKNNLPSADRAGLAAELRNGRAVAPWLIDGQHRSEIARRLFAAAADQDANSSGAPDLKPSGPR